MLLAVDIGNSTISIGLFDSKGILQFLSSLDTDPRKTADQICVDLMNLFQLYRFRYEDVTDSILWQRCPAAEFYDCQGSDSAAWKAAYGHRPRR